jgi:uncharacterized protein
MLTGTQVRVKIVRQRVVPQYLDSADPHWQQVAGQLVDLVRESVGRTRGELAADLENITAAGPEALVWAGLAKLLDDRCDDDVPDDPPPEELRERAFALAAEARKSPAGFDRIPILQTIAAERSLTPEQIDEGLFADLRDERRIRKFDPCTPEYLLKRYNVALAQAMLVRSVGMEVTVWGETVPRYRQLFRAAKFHKLIGQIKPHPQHADAYQMTFDGPLSLFSATQKYGLQLALFLPTLMHGTNYEVKATIRWGAERKEKQFTLSSAEGLPSHTPDFGQYRPAELDAFAKSFRAKAKEWDLDAEPAPFAVGDEIWVPDFRATNRLTGKSVDLEVIGYWRKPAVDKQLERLRTHRPGQYLLLIGEQYRADDSTAVPTGPDVISYKRTPSAADVLTALDTR